MATPRIVYQRYAKFVPASIEGASLFALRFTTFPQTLTKIFRYSAGTPPATGFTFSVYTSEGDAQLREDALSDDEVATFLDYYFIPATPESDAVDAEVFLVVTLINVPDWLDAYEELYGVVCLEQDMNRVPIGDPVIQEISPRRKRRRQGSVFSNWSRK